MDQLYILNANSSHLQYTVLHHRDTTMRRDTFSTPELPPSSTATRRQCLDGVPLGQPFFVQRVLADPSAPERARQLEEIGFNPGEQVMVMTRGIPGGDPLVVRVGQSTFALRGAEAACIQVEGAGGRAA
jgi:ferrous iron transport protein A